MCLLALAQILIRGTVQACRLHETVLVPARSDGSFSALRRCKGLCFVGGCENIAHIHGYRLREMLNMRKSFVLRLNRRVRERRRRRARTLDTGRAKKRKMRSSFRVVITVTTKISPMCLSCRQAVSFCIRAQMRLILTTHPRHQGR